MHVYYINTAARTDRRTFMENQLDALGIRAERVGGIVPAELTAEQIDAYCNPERGGTLRISALCCNLSHLKVAAELIESGETRAMVLEDDAVLSPRLTEFLSAFEAADPDIGLLRIETHLQPIRYRASSTRLAGVAIVRPFGWEPGAAGYILSRRAAQALIADPQMRLANDFTLFNPFGRLARRVTLRQAVPALCIQSHHTASGAANSFGSDNQSPPWIAPLTLGQRLSREARWIWHRDLVMGSRKLVQQLLGARKQVIPFARDERPASREWAQLAPGPP
jgi:glycosyl transferase family 25